jgi:DNA invertase Pin-like site-specific DNA recombinase
VNSKKKYLALARVSTREQEREGFSLDVQVDALRQYAERTNGEIIRFFRIAETASKHKERKIFKELLAFAKKNAHTLDGLLFYKVDRAARNLFDYVELERLESEFDIQFISVSQPTENTPAGRMQRRILANMASFYTEQQSIDVKEGIARRVAEGWFPSNPPYGYRNVRIDGRSIVKVHPQNHTKVRRIFDLRANQILTVPEIMERLFDEGIFYTDSKPKFSESKVYAILHDRSYLGFILFRDDWHSGNHEPLVDQVTWDLVRLSFDEQNYRSHELVYASRLIRCGHCGHIVTGEEKFKETKKGTKSYIYYRCSRYRSAGHPRVRLTEKELDDQLQEMLAPLGNMSDEADGYVQMVARAILEARCRDETVQVSESKRLLSLLETQRAKLLNRNLSGTVSDELYDRQSAEFDEQEKALQRQLARHEQVSSQIDEVSGQAGKVFDVLANDWLKMERRARQLVLTALFGGFTLEGRTLVPSNRTRLELFRAG